MRALAMVQMDGRIVVMVAKFSSTCQCGAFIERGDNMSYDTLMKKTLCYQCVRKNVEFSQGPAQALPAKPVDDPAFGVIDRFRALRLHPRPYPEHVKEEMRALVSKFRHEYGGKELVRKFVDEIAKCSHKASSLVSLKARFPSVCIHCSTRVRVGDLVFYDHQARRMHCLACDCLR